MMKVAVGHSENVDSRDAIVELIGQCEDTLGGLTPQACILFSAIDHDFEILLEGIMDRYPGIDLVGCTTDGEVSSVSEFAEDSVTAMLFCADTVAITAGLGRQVREDPATATRHAVEMATANAKEPVKLCIALPEGLGIDTGAVLKGLSEALGTDVPICGGMSADQLKLTGTYQFFKGEVCTDAVPILLFSGPVLVSCSVASGWNPIGKTHRVTRAHGNVVATIDNEPATSLYTHYQQKNSMHFPLAVYANDADEFYLSTPAAFDDDGSIAFLNTVPSGSRVQLSDATRDEIISGASASAERAFEAYPGSKPSAGLLFSCSARRNALGTRTKEEYQLLRQRMRQGIPVCGFYTYGEICPLPGSPSPQTHNTTFVTVLIGEV